MALANLIIRHFFIFYFTDFPLLTYEDNADEQYDAYEIGRRQTLSHMRLWSFSFILGQESSLLLWGFKRAGE
jgi:hypothetical protein